MIAKPCLDGFLQESTFRINLSLKFNLVTILHQKGERLWKKNKKMLAEQSGSETWGNLLEVENAFCSKISSPGSCPISPSGNVTRKLRIMQSCWANKENKAKWKVATHLLVFYRASSQGILLPVLVHHLQTLTTHGASFSWRIPKFFSGCPWLGWSRPLQRTESGEDPV